MNRQMKRQQQRQQARAGGGGPDRAAAAATARRGAVQEKRKRTGARQFLKEVRQELRKVDWPTRPETIAYTIVVLVSVVVLTSYVFGLDYGFAHAIVKLLGS